MKWRTTDEQKIQPSKEGPGAILLQRLVYDGTGEVCFTLTQQTPEDQTFKVVVIAADQMREIRRFFAGLKA